MPTIKLTLLAWISCLALLVTAFPPSPGLLRSPSAVLHKEGAFVVPASRIQEHADPERTDAPNPSVCTIGQPASEEYPGSALPINDYTRVMPTAQWTSFAVDETWAKKHFVSGPHIISTTHASEPYGAFKCQYTCNAAEHCSSYFVWYENIGSENEQAKCLLFDSIIEPDIFVPATGTIAVGGYDKLCGV